MSKRHLTATVMHLKSVLIIAALLVSALASTQKAKKIDKTARKVGKNHKTSKKPDGGVKAVKVVKAHSKKAAKASDTLSPDATSKDFEGTDCSKLTAKFVNSIKDFKACSGLTAECAKQFDTTEVSPQCFVNIPISEWKKFDPKTVAEFTNGKVEDFSLTAEQFTTVLPKLKLDTLPSGFSGFVVRDEPLLEALFASEDAKVLTAFLTADNVAALSPPTFRRMGKSLIAALKDDAFSKISAVQLALIPADKISAISTAQLIAIPPAAFSMLSKYQAESMPKESWNALTAVQIKNFGPSTSSAMQLSAKDADARKQELLNRKQFKTSHPCGAVPAIKAQLEETQAKALEERCKDVEAFDVSSSPATKSSLLAATVFVLFAAVPAFFM